MTLALTIGFRVSFQAPTLHSHGGIDADPYARSNEVDRLPIADDCYHLDYRLWLAVRGRSLPTNL